ncbi:isocitrate lyase/phosphoenolpyruvate mutase family protein [Pseudahrensia aquimaris]|uniref:Isocitrate lyase/phosphoenolpyruvate mutase family protein n=1 Tax=Pseudahrensia aquimaris TaxID=744461 RepID=A0ABW3FGJ2_9HYPH
MTDQAEKARDFREMHTPGDPFVLPNAYDVGSAKMLAALGADAIATTSAGFAFTVGEPDGCKVTRDQMLDHCEDVCRAVSLPVSADLENGYADDPAGVAEMIELAAEVGLVGCTLEDTTMETAKPSYDFDIAVARMEAAVEAAEALPFEFTVCARADGVMIGSYDLDEAIRRIQAYEEVGAHCVYIPMPASMEDLKLICASVGVPVNALCAGPFVKYSKVDFAKAGAARISVGSALSRVTHKIVHDIGKAMIENGDFSALALGMSGTQVDALLAKGSA